MRLLFVHEVNWHKKVVYEIHDFPELLSKRGHEIVFIDFAEDASSNSLSSFLQFRTNVATNQTRAHPGARVEVRTPGRVLPSPFDRFVASATQVPTIWRALKRERFDAIVLYGVPTNGWQTLWLARHFNVPVLFRAIDISHLLRKTMFNHLIKMAEHYIYRHANAISTHNEALRRYCIEHGADPERISIEYPGLDLERFAPGPRDPDLCALYGLEPHHKIILFMGTFYRFAGLDWFVDALSPVLRQRPEVRLLLVGGGEEEAALRRQVVQLGLAASVIFTGFIDYPKLADHLRLADIAFNTFRKSLVTDCALPGKIMQYLGCGLPTVCTPLDGLRAMLPEGNGILYRELGPDFIQEIVNLLTDDAKHRVIAKAARENMERYCRWETCVEPFERAIVRMIVRHRGACGVNHENGIEL